MRPEPHGDGVGCMTVLCVILMVVGAEIIDYKNTVKPHKEFIKTEAKSILDDAHARAVMAVDTINFVDYYDINVKSARKDSVHLTKQMCKTVDNLYGNKNYMWYEKDTNSVKHLVDGRTIYGLISHFDQDKAMHNPEFADTYNKYYETIKNLEIARRQENNK